LVEPYLFNVLQYRLIALGYAAHLKSKKVGISYCHVQNSEEECWKKYMRFGESYSGSKDVMVRDITVIADFLNEEEERSLHEEVEPYMRRLRYEFDHWDDVS
jgi:hypothetical protein